jgi:glutathione peroxidase-family protein
MFKLFSFLIPIVITAFSASSSVFDITESNINGQAIKLDTFGGKKIIVVEFDPGNYNESQLLTLDTIQRTNSQVQVIAVPAKDFGSTATLQQIQSIIQNLNLSFIVTVPAFVKKTAGIDQDALFDWLTHLEKNSHFDIDADDPGQIYLVNGSGELYALLEKGTANAVIKDLADQ